MELRQRIIDCLEESSVFTHSIYDAAKGRLESRPLKDVNIAVFCDFFSGEYDNQIINKINDFMYFFQPEDNARILIPELNNVSNRIARKLKRKHNTSCCRVGESSWRIPEYELEEKLINKIVEVSDVVFFVTSWKNSRYEELYRRVREDGYLVARSLIHETRNT